MKKIKIHAFNFIRTNIQATIDKAIIEGFTITDILVHDRTAIDAQIEADRIQGIVDAKAEQDLINDTENKPRIISALDDIPYHERTKAQYDGFTYEILRSYFTLMVGKQNHIKEILELKFLEDIIENWDIEGAKTDAVLQTEIVTLLADETRTRPLPPPVDNTENITNVKLALNDIPYPDKNQTEIDVLSWEELSEYHSKMVHKQNLISEIISLKGLDNTRANWDIEGVKTYEVIVLEIESLRPSDD